jgi:hypothetical protein
LVVVFGPAIDRLGSATRGFGAMPRIVVLSILEEIQKRIEEVCIHCLNGVEVPPSLLESVAESSARRVLPMYCYGQTFWEWRAEVTIKD